jgi:hypothetical protein
MERYINPKLILAATIGLLVIFTSQSSILACDQCQKPQVVTFDCKVIPVRPSDTADATLAQKIIAWRDLFWASAGIKTYLFNTDPTKDCFTHLDGSFFTQGDTVARGIKFGDEWSNLPQADGAAGGDYLVTGNVDGTDGAYSVTAELQVSKTREVVSSASVAFTEAVGSVDAGKSAAQALGPVLDKIRAFEKKKRATGDPYALQPTAELYPKKSTVNKGEAVEVEVWLYDCDGTIATSPLANRPVELTATGGTLSASTVTTGSDGKAVVTFTAGSAPTEALLQAIYPFKMASEFESVSNGGAASIKITPAPSTLWRVSGLIWTDTEYDEIKRGTAGSVNEFGHQSSRTSSRFNVNAVIRNVAHDSLNLFESDTVPVSLRISGSHSEDEMSNGYATMPDFWSKNQSYQTVTCTPKKSTENAEDVRFSFFYTPSTSKTKSTRSFSLSGWDMKGSATTYEQSCNSEEGCTSDNPSSDAEGPIEAYVGVLENDTKIDHDSSYTDAAGNTWQTGEQKWIQKVGNSFEIYSYNFQNEISLVGGATLSTNSYSRTETLYNFWISPLDSVPTSVGRPSLTSAAANSRGLDAQIRFRGNTADVRFNAPAIGAVTVRLYTVQGRLISRQEFPALQAAGPMQLMLKTPRLSGVVCVELVFTSATGKENRQTLVANRLGGGKR